MVSAGYLVAECDDWQTLRFRFGGGEIINSTTLEVNEASDAVEAKIDQRDNPPIRVAF